MDQQLTRQCYECSQSHPLDEVVAFRESSYICAYCKPLVLQKLLEGGNLPSRLNFAGFWPRAAAKLIDGIILMIVSFFLNFLSVFVSGQESNPTLMVAAQFVIFGLNLMISLSYYIIFVGRFGATPGKMALNLKIVTADGSRVSYARAAGRVFAEYLSQFTILIGYLICLFDDEKRTLHDHICNTRVVQQ